MGVTDVGIAEARRDLSAIINRVVYGGERIILASRGKPKAAIISIEDLHRLEEMEKTVDESARTERKAALAMAKAVQEMSLRRRKGVPFPDVSKDLQELREERTHELSGMR
jgi:prevent-host-death family protein